VSIGIAEKSAAMATPEQLIARSDECMYRAKELGRNRTVLYKEGSADPFVLVTPGGLDEDTSHSTTY